MVWMARFRVPAGRYPCNEAGLEELRSTRIMTERCAIKEIHTLRSLIGDGHPKVDGAVRSVRSVTVRIRLASNRHFDRDRNVNSLSMSAVRGSACDRDHPERCEKKRSTDPHPDHLITE